ncbi:hypothetical protein ABBQ38_010858 [Trebouxia sp. C0009 RCD-2024]
MKSWTKSVSLISCPRWGAISALKVSKSSSPVPSSSAVCGKQNTNNEEHHDISPTFAPPGQRSASPALQADASTLKQKANHEADASVESYKRLRPTDTVSPAAHVSLHLEKHMVYDFEVEIAAAEDKGSRVDMEDIHVIKHDARQDRSSACRVIWAAIFDGHAGKQVAALASKHLHENTVLSGFLDALNFLAERLPTSKHRQSLDIKTMRKAIATGFAVTDQEALAQAQQHHWLDGAVCVAVWIVQDTVFVANVMRAVCWEEHWTRPAALRKL